jgi:hypothetical protein
MRLCYEGTCSYELDVRLLVVCLFVFDLCFNVSYLFFKYHYDIVFFLEIFFEQILMYIIDSSFLEY